MIVIAVQCVWGSMCPLRGDETTIAYDDDKVVLEVFEMCSFIIPNSINVRYGKY